MIHEDVIHYDCQDAGCRAANGRIGRAAPKEQPWPRCPATIFSPCVKDAGHDGEHSVAELDVERLALFFHGEYWDNTNEPHYPREQAKSGDCAICWGSADRLMALLAALKEQP